MNRDHPVALSDSLGNLSATEVDGNFKGSTHNDQTRGRDEEKVSYSLLPFIHSIYVLILVILLLLVTAMDGFDDNKVNNY